MSDPTSNNKPSEAALQAVLKDWGIYCDDHNSDEACEQSDGCTACAKLQLRLAHFLDTFAADAVKAERRMICDWIQNNLGERGMTDLLLDIHRRGGGA